MLLESLDKQIRSSVRTALDEDLGPGDLTAHLIPEDALARAEVVCRETAVLCGCAWFDTVFRELDERIQIDWLVSEGAAISAGQCLCRLRGPARPLLSGERTALNFLQTLSATASLARRYADAVSGSPVTILDTRKTLPGLRLAQKHAVRTGGCHNHRLGLYDGILIKENHIAAAGSIRQAVDSARRLGTDLPVEVEVESPEELEQALAAGAEIVLLDNFSLDGIRDAVKRTAGRAKLEVSGGVSLDTVADLAATGVDFISVGALTKDVQAIDLSLRLT